MKLFAIEPKATLWIREGIVPETGAKAWIAWFLAFFNSAKEAVEGESDALQCILNDLGMNPVKLRAILFDLGQLIGLSLVVDGKMTDSISVPTLLEGGVV